MAHLDQLDSHPNPIHSAFTSPLNLPYIQTYILTSNPILQPPFRTIPRLVLLYGSLLNFF